MVNFINDNGQGQLVNQLASQAQINDQRGSSSSANSTHASVGKYGNQGTVNVPTAMQGTWYSAEYGDSSITFGAHTLAVHGDGDGEGSQLTLYRQDPHADFDMDDHSIQNATKSWGRTTFNNVDGLNFLTVQGWCQSAGDGSSYAIHTETINGKKVQVLVEAGGAGFWTEGVYYRSQSMAKQQAKVHYDDLHY